MPSTSGRRTTRETVRRQRAIQSAIKRDDAQAESKHASSATAGPMP